MNILYFLPDLNNPFWIEISQSATKEAISHNYSLKAIGAEDNSEIQVAQINEYKDKNPDAILVSPVEVEKISDICNEIRQSGIPIVAIDQHMVHCVHASVMSGNLTGGISAAKFIGEQTDMRYTIVHVKAPKGYENAALRRKSFINETQRQHGEIIKVLEGACNRETSKFQMRQFLEEKVEFQAVFAENDVMALGVVDALKEVNYTPWPIIVGFDGISEAVECIRKKEMAATIQQKPHKMGEEAVKLIIKIKEKLPYDDVVNISTQLLTIDSIS